ncbi:hypothetical protein QCO44_07125 [Selenomonas sputigena]|uniref:Tat pathway signal sequence domain protein n=1 Tax=Selenomonas sputigena TaxID=69823 RepID=A0ABV3X5E0_9FIRM
MLQKPAMKSQEVKPKAQADWLGFCKGVRTYVQRASLMKMAQKTGAKQLMPLRVAAEHMSSKLAMKIASAALAAFALASAVVSAMPASEEAQIQAIADAQNLWKDEFVALRDKGQLPQPYLLNMTPEQTRFAVTDLDGNGRLELLFRHAAVPTGDKGAIPRPFHYIPTAVGMAVYEIDADGRLQRLPEEENGYGCPDLKNLDVLHAVRKDGTRWYNICTRTHIESVYGYFSYIDSYQQIAIVNGKVKVKNLAEKSGHYNVFDWDRVEEVPTSASIFDGDPAHREMRPEDFERTNFYRDFHRTYDTSGQLHMMSCGQLLEDPRATLNQSWFLWLHHDAVEG